MLRLAFFDSNQKRLFFPDKGKTFWHFVPPEGKTFLPIRKNVFGRKGQKSPMSDFNRVIHTWIYLALTPGAYGAIIPRRANRLFEEKSNELYF